MMSSRENSDLRFPQNTVFGKGKILEDTTNTHIVSFNQLTEAERAGSLRREATVLARMISEYRLAKVVDA